MTQEYEAQPAHRRDAEQARGDTMTTRITEQRMAEAQAQLEDWYAAGTAKRPADADLVPADHGCTCGERRVDELVWITDDSFRCATCGEITSWVW